MKKMLTFCVSLVVLSSCIPWDATMIDVKEDPISPKLLTLERRIEDVSNSAVITSDDELKIFTLEVEKNLIDPYGEKYGYIAFKKNIIKESDNSWLFGLYFYTAFIPNLLGVPFGRVKYVVEVELRIYDRENSLIGKYTEIGEAETKVKLFNGYFMTDAGRRTYPEALSDAFDKIRPQIRADVERLNKRLLEAGPL